MASPQLEPLEGRIIAIELMMRGLLYEWCERAGSLNDLAKVRDSLLGSLQNVDRPADERADRIWAEAIQAIRDTFANLENRAEHNQRRS